MSYSSSYVPIMQQTILVIQALQKKFGLDKPEQIIPIVWPMVTKFVMDGGVVDLLELDSYPIYEVGMLDFIHTAMVQSGVMSASTLLEE